MAAGHMMGIDGVWLEVQYTYMIYIYIYDMSRLKFKTWDMIRNKIDLCWIKSVQYTIQNLSIMVNQRESI